MALTSPFSSTSEPIIDTPPPLAEISIEEAVKLGAFDSEFYSRTFFPKTFRQPSPPFAAEQWKALEDPTKRYVLLESFRGSAKTTRLRAFISKRIAYQISRTILIVGASEPDAVRTIQWIRGQVERNKLWAGAFGLSPGKKWIETEIELVSSIGDYNVWVKGVGINSSLRGVNFDDYRPDLIICDDILSDENTLTLESRQKISDLLFGAVAKSLSQEEPNAKLAMLQTPINREDACADIEKHELWTTLKFPCWSQETKDLPDDYKKSAWEEMFPTESLLKEKKGMIAVGKVHLFLREMECSLSANETSVLRPALLKYYENIEGLPTSCIAIDPVPPPSEREIKKNLHGKNFEAIGVISRWKGEYYLRYYELMRGHNPNWTLAKFFELALRFRISHFTCDMVAYQSVLKWMIEQEMARRGQFYSFVPDPLPKNKSKYSKIVDTIQPLMQLRKLNIMKDHTDIVSHMAEYPGIQYDDLLDMFALGLRSLVNPSLELREGEYEMRDEYSEPINFIRRAP